ncbi:MAG: hypothetical protein ACD_18C00254G0001 [uncultured bacterium]|nr:MAG: hypothetical protein ACD_18C00254G0001 [uncultured bacterium]
MKKTITAHCIVKNEENFIFYAIKSVVDFVDKIIVFDTGSEDKTVEIIEKLLKEYPEKIVFEEKGTCDKKRHTELRQEMLEKTTSDWFMILDGDEIWNDRGMKEALEIVNYGEDEKIECLIVPFYLCVGDIYHKYYKKGDFEILGKKGFFSPRLIKIVKDIHWSGDYNEDTLLFNDGKKVFRENNTIFLKNKYWHVTHLKRSSLDDNDYSSGGTRKKKLRLSYFLIGRKIKESIPRVFKISEKKLNISFLNSFFNLLILIKGKLFVL